MIGYFVGMAAQSNAAGVLAKKEQVAQTGCRREIPKRWLWRFWDEGDLEKTIRMHAGRGARMAGAQRLLAAVLLFTLVVAVAWTPSDTPTPATFSDLPQESIDAP